MSRVAWCRAAPLTQRAEACLPAVQEMNPLVSVECVTTPLASLPDAFFQAFRAVVLTGARRTLEVGL
jgi:hypothetical protein